MLRSASKALFQNLLLLIVAAKAHDVGAQEFEQFSWPPVPGAKYFEGTASDDNGTTHFRTRDTKIVVKPKTKVTVSGFDKSSRPLDTEIKVEQKALSSEIQQPPQQISTPSLSSPTAPIEEMPAKNKDASERNGKDASLDNSEI